MERPSVDDRFVDIGTPIRCQMGRTGFLTRPGPRILVSLLLLLIVIISHQAFHEGSDNAGLREIAVLSGPAEPIYCLDFSPDGKALATLGMDESVRLWDVDARRKVADLRDEHQSPFGRDFDS
jgi:WD40 repeat protein